MCVIVSFQGGDQGSPSCKLLGLGQMVDIDPTIGKNNNKRDREDCVCVYQH